MYDTAHAAFQFVSLLAVEVPFAIGNGYLASRLNRNTALWVVLTLIPLVNWFFAVYVVYTVVFYVIDRLKDVTKGSAPVG